MNVTTVIVQVDNRVAYQLARPMIGDVSSPVGFIYSYTLLIQLLIICQDVFETAFAAHGKTRMVFKKNYRVRDNPLAPGGIEAVLEPQCGIVFF